MAIEIITQYEHGEWICGDEQKFCLIKERELELIKSIDESEKKLCFGYYIGLDWLVDNNSALYIEPKLNKEARQTDYLKMLFSALRFPEYSTLKNELFGIKFGEPHIEIENSKDLLTPLLVVQFLRVVREIVKKGLKKSYYRVERNLNGRVKGKILVGQTIRRNLSKNKQAETYCSFEEYGIDGLENRLLKRALVFVRRYLSTLNIPNSKEYTTDLFNFIMPVFELVSEEVSLNEIKQSKTNIFYKEYEEGIKLAKLILKRFGYNINNTQLSKVKTPPFWIDMSKLFEMYVLGLLKERFGRELKFQFQANYGKLDYILPDKNLIIDAKYKTYYKERFTGMDQWKRDSIAADIRQLSGYSRDKKVLNLLSVANEKIIPECLMIFPEELNDREETLELADFSLKVPIDEFENFYKLSVKLPSVKS